MTNKPSISWECLSFQALNVTQLHAIFKARGEVFVVEQKCTYPDADDMDHQSHHLIGWGEPNVVAAYLRLIQPGAKYDVPAIGRVLTTKPYRKAGLGREVMRQGLGYSQELYPGHPVKISAQQYLEKFYQELGFKTISAPYDEVGIQHIDMVFAAAK